MTEPALRVACPSCGVAVTPGYVKCPKCHAALPVARVRAAAKGVGGTAVEERSPPWVLIGLGAVAVLAVMIGLLMRGGGGSKPARAPTAVDTAGAPIEEVQPAGSTSVQPVGPVTPEPGTDPGVPLAVTTGALDRDLQAARLWSSVGGVPPRLTVQSASCGEPALDAVLGAHTRALRAAGFVSVQCRQQNGTLVFDRPL